MLKLALDAAMPLIERQRENRAHGLVCEFCVGSGKSMRMTQEILPLDIEMHGFDTLYVFRIFSLCIHWIILVLPFFLILYFK